MPHAFQSGRDRRQQRKEVAIDQQHIGLGVVESVENLLGIQAHIDRLQDGTHHRHGKEAFEIAMAIPVHDRHSVPGLDAEAGQPTGQTADPLTQRAVRVAHLSLVANLLLWRDRQGRVQQLLDEQRIGIRRRRGRHYFHGHDQSRAEKVEDNILTRLILEKSSSTHKDRAIA